MGETGGLIQNHARMHFVRAVGCIEVDAPTRHRQYRTIYSSSGDLGVAAVPQQYSSDDQLLSS